MGLKKEKIHDFKKSLSKGMKSESEFFELFKDKLIRESGYIMDFTIIKSNKTIELKTDSYYNSGNFFIERFSYDKAPGGPWQSLQKKVDYYVIWFPATMSVHCFKTKELVKWLDKNYEDPYLINVKNTSHVTQGFLVKRDELLHLEIKMEDIL